MTARDDAALPSGTPADIARDADELLDVDIEKRLGAFHLQARFSVHGRGVVALFGRSGSGKSTLIGSIAGLIRPDAGRIVLGGEALFDRARDIDVRVERRRVGYVFQEGRLFPHLSVRDNLLYGWKRAAATERRIHFDGVVTLLGIEGLLDRRPARLSGGEKQRVAIGRALLAQPRVLLMDEPLASLDAPRKAEILPYIERLRDELGLLIVYVSHALDEVYRIANTMVVLDQGKVVASGTPDALSQRLDLWPLLGRFEAGAVIEVGVASHDDEAQLTRLAFASGELVVARIDVPVGARLRVRVRARDVILATIAPRGLSVQNVLRGRVVEIAEEQGPFAEVKLMIGETPILARITRDSLRRLELQVGREAYALVKTVAIGGHVLSAAPRYANEADEAE